MNTQMNLPLAKAEARKGIAKVSGRNAAFLVKMRRLAMKICHGKGYVTADDLHEWADNNGIEPTHPNAWGGVFRTPDFYADGYVTSANVAGHGNRIMRWRLVNP